MVNKMTYEEAMSFLEDTKKYGIQPGLGSIKALMRELGDVQERVPIVHIAGTNGKGSVGAMLSSVLSEAGYLVGRFATPDVFSYEEEFLMNGKPIEKERLAGIFTKVADKCKELVRKGRPHPTRFEVETAAAFLWFQEENCDIALVEVGMGGATDATNLIRKPLVSVLTSISRDHTKFLGDTLAGIASAKAGIIKEGCRVVSVRQEPKVMAVIRETCEKRRAPLEVADVEMTDEPVCRDGAISFSWDASVFADCAAAPFDITLGLRGDFQLQNAVCALKVLEVLKKKYPRITPSVVSVGMQNVRWPGRFEQILSSPDVFLDGAHNEDAVSKLRIALDHSFPKRKIIYIMGVLADKEYDRMIRLMFRAGDRVYTVTPPNSRALSAEELAAQLKRQKVDAISCENPRDAVSYALAEADARDVILAFGSLYYLNGVRTAFREAAGEHEVHGKIIEK
ncbi:MAG: bifunctional folylpolyglutamate synthase/dihydrofolate synthase [Clostridiales bacterium]|nr:bifunctional folylpolyglutamate synthase/dihydrofolate synthase [Clostridiales bacterium]